MDVDGCVEVRRYDRQQLLSAIKAVIRKRSEKSDACCKIYSFLQGCVANQSQSFVFQIQICVNKSEVSFFVGIITSSSLLLKMTDIMSLKSCNQVQVCNYLLWLNGCNQEYGGIWCLICNGVLDVLQKSDIL